MSDDPNSSIENSENTSAPAADDGDDAAYADLAAKAYEKGRNAAYAELRRKGELQREPKPVAHPKAALVDRILSTLDADDDAFATSTARQANLLQRLRTNGVQPRPGTAPAPTTTGGSAMEMYAQVMMQREMRAMREQDAAEAQRQRADAEAALSPDVRIQRNVEAVTAKTGRPLTEAERVAAIREELRRTKVTADPRRMQSIKIKPGGR